MPERPVVDSTTGWWITKTLSKQPRWLADGTFDAATPSVVDLPLHVEPKFGYIYVDATINGSSGALILDTGMPILLLNGNHNVASTPIDEGESAPDLEEMGGVLPIHQLQQVQLGGPHGLNLTNVGAFSYRGFFPGVEQRRDTSAWRPFAGQRVLGILGLAQLRPFLSVFDYQAGLLRLYRLDSRGRPLARMPAPVPATSVPMSFQLGIPYLPVTIGEETLSLVLDTGAMDDVLHVTIAARHTDKFQSMRTKDGSIRSAFPITAWMPDTTSMETLVTEVPKRRRLHVARLDRLRIGTVDFDSVPFEILHDSDHSNTGPHGEPGGVLGTGSLSQRPWGINLRTRTFFVWR